MRSAFLLAALSLLPGCVGSWSPDAPPERSVTLRDGPWTLTLTWAHLSGAPGEEVAFLARIRTEGEPSPYQSLLPNGSFVTLGGRHSGEVHGTEAAFEGRAIVGAVERLRFTLVAQDGTGGSLRRYVFEGPAVTLREGVRATPVPIETLWDVADVGGGLSAERRNGSLVVTYAANGINTNLCDETVWPAGEWVLVEGDGPPRLVAFVNRSTSDACAPMPPSSPRVVATLPGAPEPLDVVIVGIQGCDCITMPWFREHVTA